MSTDEAILEKLDQLIAATRLGRREWLDINAVASYIGYSVEHTRQRFIVQPDFPAPARPKGGHPRWKREDIDAWMQSQTQR